MTRFEQLKKCGLIGNYISETIYTHNKSVIKAKTYDIENTIYKRDVDIMDKVVTIDVDCSEFDCLFTDIKKIILDDIIGLSFDIKQSAITARYEYLIKVNKRTLVNLEIPILKDRTIYYICINNIEDVNGIKLLKIILRRHTNRFKHVKDDYHPKLSNLLVSISWFIIRPFRKSDV